MRPREDERCTKLVASARVGEGYMGEHIGVRWGVGEHIVAGHTVQFESN